MWPLHQGYGRTLSSPREEGTVTYFSQKEFQAFVAAIVGRANCSWLALSGHVLSKEQVAELKHFLDGFFRNTEHVSFKKHHS